MSKRLIFAGTKENGYFAYEEALSRGWEIEFVTENCNFIKKQIADISSASDKGCDAIIYDARDYLEDAEVIADVISSIRRANGAKPILLVATSNPDNALIRACLNRDIKLFINTGTGTASDFKRELVLTVTGHYDATDNEQELTKKAREYIDRKKIENDACITVGVTGACHRIGTTTQAIQITRYLASLGYKTCLVEMNENRYQNKRKRLSKKEELSFFEKTRLLFETEIDQPEIGYIRFQGMDIYYKQDMLSELSDMNYDYLVYDYGVYTDIGFNKTAFLKDNLQFFCAGAGAAEIDFALDVAENVSYKKADLIFSFTAEGDRNEIRLAMEETGSGNRCFFTEYTPNPYILSNLKIYNSMIPISGNLKNQERDNKKPGKKRKRFFGRSRNE